MKAWHAMLEAFADLIEPEPWDLPHVKRLTVAEKFEAVQYLLEHGLVYRAGRRKQEHSDNLYAITESGKFIVATGVTSRWQRKDRTIDKSGTTLAQRTVEKAHTSVFDLCRVPWRYSIREEYFRNNGEYPDESQRCTAKARTVPWPPKVGRQRDLAA